MRILAIIWGVGGIVMLLIFAILRLSPIAANAFEQQFEYWHWLLLIVNTFAMAYYEGYKGFQLAFSPRSAARARFLFDQGTKLQLILAPFFCMAYFHAPRRRIIATWVLTISIIILILLFQRLPQPTRGVLDVGVVVGLSWGLIATLASSFYAFTRSEYNYDPEVSAQH